MDSTILIIEDDREINRLICEFLNGAGFKMLQEENGPAGINRLKADKSIDLCILDLMLPMKSGDMVIKELREFSDIPVIIVSAKDTVQNKIDLFRLGADDYITKPFDLDELLARVEAVLKRRNSGNGNSGDNISNNSNSNLNSKLNSHLNSKSDSGSNNNSDTSKDIFKYKNIVMDDMTKEVTVNSQKIDLTVKEYGILKLLLSNKGRLFSKANLYESIWDDTYLPDDTAVKVHMSNLRNKIKKYDDEEYIETVWGMGYKLAK